MHDPLDDKLKDRLSNYSEEPDDALWSGIASNIQSVKPTPVWVKPVIWSGAVIVLLLTSVLMYQFNERTTSGGTLMSGQKEKPLTGKSNPVVKKDVDHVDVVRSTDKSPGDRHESIATEPAHSNESSAVTSERSSSSALVTPITELKRERAKVHAPRPLSGKNVTPANTAPVDRLIASLPEENNSSKDISAPDTMVNSATAENKSDEVPAVKNEMDAVVTVDAERESIMVKEEDHNKPSAFPVKSDSSVTAASAVTIAAHPSEKPADEIKEQKKDDRPTNNRKLNLYFTAMPTFGYQRIESNKNDNVLIESVGKVSKFSTKRLGVRAEFGAEYRITNRTRVFGGVLYYQRKQTIDYIEKTVTNEVTENVSDTVVILDPRYNSVNKTFEYELKNVGVQIGVNYMLKEARFIHTLGMGIEFHKALNKAPDSGKNSGFSSDPSTFVFYNLYYRVQYPATGRLKAVFQPTFNYSLYLNQDMNAPFYVKPYGLGLNLGVTYALGFARGPK